MKRFLIMILAMLMLFSVSVVPSVSAAGNINKITINGKPYVRTFYDEFGGTQLDDTKWEKCPEYARQGNYCYWSNSMSSLDGKGHLILSCDYDDNGRLLTGAVRTKNRFYQKYGYFEISVKLQPIEGIWSAFWLMPDIIDYGYTGGADGTEIDIYEAFGVNTKQINHALHYDGYGANHTSIGSAVTADVYDGEYHNFALKWDETGYTFLIDGKQTYQITPDTIDGNGNNVQVSQIASYLKISIESGSWTGLPDTSDVPSGIVVDYVKVYQPAEDYVATHVVYGDLDLDLEISMADIKILREYLVKRRSDIIRLNADVFDDNIIDIKDVLVLRKYLANEITQLP